jgi:DNA-binding GntR family transcriptional regulator
MQDHLAKEFAASHVPVREAFRKLEAQGLIVSKPRCGVRVSHLDPGVGSISDLHRSDARFLFAT